MRLFSLILVTILCITLSGCNLFSRNSDDEESGLLGLKNFGQISNKNKDSKEESEVKDPELEKFQNMTPEEIENDVFGPAETLYAFFDMISLDYDPDDKITIDGMPYNAVENYQPELDSNVDFSIYENFKNYTKTIFSDEFTDKLFEESRYKNYNGKLYVLGADRGNDINYHSHTYALTKVEKDKVEYTIYAKYVKTEYEDDYFNGKWDKTTIPEEALEIREYIYPREKINGKWVFTDFCSIN